MHIADKLLIRSTPATPLTGTPGVEKLAAWSHPRPLSDVKRIGRLAAATVNDVVMGAVAGAVATYLAEHGEEATDLTTMVPVNLRPAGRPLPPELGNQFALVLLPLPTAVRTPLGRLSETKHRMDAIKSSPEAAITFGLINAIGLTHPRMERLLVDFFAGKAFGVTTNVIAPSRERYLAGSRVAGLLGWVPSSGRQAVGICTVTYDQTLRVGFKVDAGVVPDPERLVDAFDLELDRLLHMARAA
jgi:WS/DGAT/MGAT family acyltransferase